jgi:hypothetical protein
MLESIYHEQLPKSGLPIASAWNTYIETANAAGIGNVAKDTMRKRKLHFQALADWIKLERPLVETVQEIDGLAAAAYAANYAAHKSDNGIVQVATLVTTAAYQFATNTADTRSWVTLPKQIGLCRIDLPKDRRVKLNVNGRQVDVDILNDGDVHVIYLRTMHSNSTATVWQFKVR